MKWNILSSLFLLAMQCLLSGGCATGALWEEGRFARYHEPAVPPNLRLSQMNEEVLVEYDESLEESDITQRRAYWLSPNISRVEQRRRPQFVESSTYEKLVPIQIAQPPTSPDLQEIGHYWAEAGTNGYSFTLHSGDTTVGSYELPVYADASGRTKQILLTPITIVADLTIVGGFIFVMAWSTGGLGWIH
jgi:hypothetical protein